MKLYNLWISTVHAEPASNITNFAEQFHHFRIWHMLCNISRVIDDVHVGCKDTFILQQTHNLWVLKDFFESLRHIWHTKATEASCTISMLQINASLYTEKKHSSVSFQNWKLRNLHCLLQHKMPFLTIIFSVFAIEVTLYSEINLFFLLFFPFSCFLCLSNSFLTCFQLFFFLAPLFVSIMLKNFLGLKLWN